MSRQKLQAEGGCMCGLVRYRIDGVPGNAGCCHCRSCQRASGAPYVAWVSINRKDFEYLATPPAQHASSRGVTRGHCVRCGTPMTYENSNYPDQLDLSVATLDDPGLIKPAFHIWMSHKLSWVEPGDGLPQYPEWRPKQED